MNTATTHPLEHSLEGRQVARPSRSSPGLTVGDSRAKLPEADEPIASASETRTRRRQAAGSPQEGSVLFTFRHVDSGAWPCLQGTLKRLHCEHRMCTICSELLCDSADGRDEASASKIKKSLKSAQERGVFKYSLST